MPVEALSSNFAGPSGALVMSFIAMSIVFLVIIGLMFVMVATNRIVAIFDKKSSEAK
ncbi:MAG: OadG family protein [Synergistaceae bacterium]|nr:OadG family protein [Synergistaceae bacterium]